MAELQLPFHAARWGYSVVLYHMGEFFAEVQYSPEDNQVKIVRCFKSKACVIMLEQPLILEQLSRVFGRVVS